ncbi:FeoA family protein [Swaminathania salitolerans]|uniref:Ferrous iron transporter A n=1 Tax=Swaminathania salitolerans TaxID=182838 RepID=A0A511BNF9_9PROT|nr:FeoA family protein [Swaminathania salitolerans]GBQ10173.1 ferrous iron transport protein A [Swaminathania salitolerans LMG 21291]GEL01194.1 ferrous iron transporter A [Swaminathania salitolerans]
MTLDTLPKGAQAVVSQVVARMENDPIATRLGELGFIPGASVEIVATGPVGRDPIAVRLGSSRFALRRGEASRIALKHDF